MTNVRGLSPPIAWALYLASSNPTMAFVSRHHQPTIRPLLQPVSSAGSVATRLSSTPPPVITFEALDDDDDEEDDDDEDDEEELELDPYEQVATSEFVDKSDINEDDEGGGVLATTGGEVSTGMDWGGALSRLRERVDDVESGKSQNPSQALFRLMSSQSPNQAIGTFVRDANPQVVQAMSGAVGSLLGGLASPQSVVEMVEKATGEKSGS